MGQRMPEFGEQGAPAVTVDERVGTGDPSTQNVSGEPQQPVSSAGADRVDAAGAPGEGEPPPSTVAQPPQSPSPPPAAPPPPPAAPPAAPPAQPAAEQTPQAGEPAPESTDDDDAADDLQRLGEFRNKLREDLKEELTAEHQQEVVKQQSGQDKVIAKVREELDQSKQQRTALRDEIRELQARGLSEEEQAKLRSTWEREDQTEGLDKYRTELEGYHDELDSFRLLQVYERFGVTEEALAAVPEDERAEFCERVRGDFFEKQASGEGQPTNGNQAQPPPQAPLPSQPQEPAPAGASAPSDTGGQGVPPTPTQADTGQGLDSIAANIGREDSWERSTFPTRRG